jgi:hypothetical protein
MAGQDWAARERMKMAAWIKPKGEHKHMLQRFWQLNMHVILCCHGEKKIEIVPNPKKPGTTMPVSLGYMPTCSPDIPYAMTASFTFDHKKPGVPIWLKVFDKLEPLIDLNNPMDEATGERLGAWARGEKPNQVYNPVKPTTTRSAPSSSAPAPEDDAPPEDRWDGTWDGQPPDLPPTDQDTPATNVSGEDPEHNSPQDRAGATEGGDRDGSPPSGQSSAPNKTEQALQALIAAFVAVKVRAEHFALVDDKATRDKIAWLKKNRPEMHARLDVEMKAAWARTAPQ